MANVIDSAQLAQIKSKFLAGDRAVQDSTPSNPVVLFDDSSKPDSLSQTTLLGLSYPLELDGNGGLRLSSGTNRIGQQIFEVLDTRFGERVYRPFMGTPELLFETISESVLQQTIKSQILASIPYLREDTVRVLAYMRESGTCEVSVFYSTEGTAQALVKYQFSV